MVRRGRRFESVRRLHEDLQLRFLCRELPVAGARRNPKGTLGNTSFTIRAFSAANGGAGSTDPGIRHDEQPLARVKLAEAHTADCSPHPRLRSHAVNESVAD